MSSLNLSLRFTIIQTNEEFEKILLHPLHNDVEREGETADEHVISGTVSYPYSLDWREKGLVSHVSICKQSLVSMH